jgi:NTP pyrophosphatase (non-canonical NTP hydrolase)
MRGHIYQELAIRTESNRFPLDDGRCNQDLWHQSRLLHAGLGLATEAGEFLDPIKKALYYGKPIDAVNLREEIGDLLWYIAIACDALNTTIDAEMVRNINKLKARYPEKFDEVRAVERNLDVERSVLENGYEPYHDDAEEFELNQLAQDNE